MTKIMLASLFFVFPLTLLEATNGRPQSASSSSTPLRLGIVKDDSQFDVCACSLFMSVKDERKRRAVFLSNLEEAAINLNGEDLTLPLTNRSLEKKGNPRIRDRSWEVYTLGNTKLRIDYTISKLCDPNDEGCEVTYYRATINLTKGAQKTIVRATGLCGC